MLLDLIKTRQSCRNYDPTRRVEKEKIDYLLNCAFLAPSARNRQPWHYVVVHNDGELQHARLLGVDKLAVDVTAEHYKK